MCAEKSLAPLKISGLNSCFVSNSKNFLPVTKNIPLNCPSCGLLKHMSRPRRWIYVFKKDEVAFQISQKIGVFIVVPSCVGVLRDNSDRLTDFCQTTIFHLRDLSNGWWRHWKWTQDCKFYEHNEFKRTSTKDMFQSYHKNLRREGGLTVIFAPPSRCKTKEGKKIRLVCRVAPDACRNSLNDALVAGPDLL